MHSGLSSYMPSIRFFNFLVAVLLISKSIYSQDINTFWLESFNKGRVFMMDNLIETSITHSLERNKTVMKKISVLKKYNAVGLLSISDYKVKGTHLLKKDEELFHIGLSIDTSMITLTKLREKNKSKNEKVHIDDSTDLRILPKYENDDWCADSIWYINGVIKLEKRFTYVPCPPIEKIIIVDRGPC